MTNNSSDYEDYDLITEGLIEALTALLIAEIVFIIVGVFINAWLLASIVTSRDLRGGMRNQMVCSIAILHLVDELSHTTLDINFYHKAINKDFSWINCHIISYEYFITTMYSIISDLQIVGLVCVLLSQVLGFDPAHKIHPLYLKTGRIAFLAFPWVFALLAGPLSMRAITSYHDHDGCYYMDFYKSHILHTAFTLTPVCVATGVVAVAVALPYKRFSRRRLAVQGNMGVHLTGNDPNGPEMDSRRAYVCSVLVCVACEVGYLALWLFMKDGIFPELSYQVAAMIMESSRCVFLPLVFLIFRDIRQRLKVWRPWAPCRHQDQSSGIDLRVVYNTKD